MTVLALHVDSTGFAAGRADDDSDTDSIRRIPLPEHSVWQHCRELLLEVAAGAEVSAVGIASAGPVDMAAGVVAPIDVPEWRTGFELAQSVRKLFPSAEVQLAYEGLCLAMAERHLGGATEAVDTLTILLSDRVSGGITAGGLSLAGRTGNAGHIGHLLVPGFDDPCSCGNRGCLEAIAGGRALIDRARRDGWVGSSIDALVAAAHAGDAVVGAALGRAGVALGLAISSVSALLDIDLVIVGGKLSSAGPTLWTPLHKTVAEHAKLAFLPGLRVIPSHLGDVGPLAGAGVLGMLIGAAAQGPRPTSSSAGQ
ncbi:ROK family protein [Nocardia brasiliensis]|uniref:ROK family protein n=1 Tax=Nocardia brasiliensis TaxID=37326 RepID=UPI0037BCA22A